MGRNRTPNAAAIKRARELAAGGRTVREVAKMLVAEGHTASKSSVASWLAGPPASPDAAAPAKADQSPRSPEPDGSATPVALAEAALAALNRRRGVAEARRQLGELVKRLTASAGSTDPLDLLESACADLRELTAIAKTARALPEFSTLQRTLNQTVALAERLRPAPPPDPNDNPDVQAAAKACRTKLHELLDHALGTTGAETKGP